MKKLYIYCGIILCLNALCLIFLAIQPRFFPIESPIQNIKHFSDDTPSDPITTDNPSYDTQDTSPDTDQTEDQPSDIEKSKDQPSDIEKSKDQQPQYICPEKLTEAINTNPDVYSWLYIPNTNIDYPVLQSQTNDLFYLRRGIDGQSLTAGSLLTEHSYNGTDFEDPITIIYGHSMKSGAMFGKLQSYYSSDNGIEKYKNIEVFLPDKKLEYEVFAAVPYDMRHILYNYDFSNPRIFSAFFKSIVSIRSFNANINADKKPKYGDKVLILSTCLKGDRTKRYLVIAKQK